MAASSGKVVHTGDSGIRVFLFEDHWMYRDALASMLGRERGIEVVGEAERVSADLAGALQARPDVVLMGWKPSGKGYEMEAIAQLKSDLPESKVVIFTDSPDEEGLFRAIEAGASAFLLKREVRDPKTVVQAIRSVHRGDGFTTPALAAEVFREMRMFAGRRRYRLTAREAEILKLVAKGEENRDIAMALGITTRTVANHVSNLLFKMAARNRTEAAAIAVRASLAPLRSRFRDQLFGWAEELTAARSNCFKLLTQLSE